MINKPVYISGAGIISPLGSGLAATEASLRKNSSAIRPLTLFDLLQGSPLPVGQVDGLKENGSLPRTHQLAHVAAYQAMQGSLGSPDAVVIGTTTGGIFTTEQLLYRDEQEKKHYRYHGLHTVASYLAGEFNCTGPVLTVSTACSSGVVAIATAMKMLRSGKAKTVLAGGVDSLCRLTYFGFNSLQLVDSSGCKPLDQDRQGMAVAEGCGMLLLTTEKTDAVVAEMLGAGLSCDAYHPAAPHPEGQGAYKAMQAALDDAGLRPEDIGYISLHGTGTPDNDLAETRGVRRIFSPLPPLSSVKGASGHSLAAAGAIETVISAIAVDRGLLPANTGLVKIDPDLGVMPVLQPLNQPTSAVLTNSFGFGGNNGSLVIGKADLFSRVDLPDPPAGLAIHGFSCLSGAGGLDATMDRLLSGKAVAGTAGMDTISANLPSRLIRRLKRLPRMTLSLAAGAFETAGEKEQKAEAVFMGTGWGALTETYDFLSRLRESEEQFPSPTDFVGSVHNAPASQVAIMCGATGANMTTSGGDYSFEQALLAADLSYTDSMDSALLLGVDEGHAVFSPLFDQSVTADVPLADGGGAFYVKREIRGAKCCISIPFFQRGAADDVVDSLLESLTCLNDDQKRCALILAGIPAAMRSQGEEQLHSFLQRADLSVPVIDYRELTGEFASASAVATALAATLLERGCVPAALAGNNDIDLVEKGDTILVLGLGQYVTAMELFRP